MRWDAVLGSDWRERQPGRPTCLPDRIDEIVSRIDILDWLAEHGHSPTRQISGVWQYHCPLPKHVDQHPSFTVKDNRWRCWSACGKSGDVIDLEVALSGSTVADAIERLAERIGTGRPRTYVTGARTASLKGKADQTPEPTPTSKPGLRSPPPSAPTTPIPPVVADEILATFVAGRGWDPAAVAEAGLTVVRDAYGRTRIQFPYHLDGEVIWHQDRALGTNTPKWLAPSGSEAFLYNADALLRADERSGTWVVEGPTDALAMRSTFDAPAVVGVPGVNAFKGEWTKAFDDIDTVLIVGDNDGGGERFRSVVAKALAPPVVRHVLQVRVPPGFGDLDDWRRGCGCDNERFAEALHQAVAHALGGHGVTDQGDLGPWRRR